MKVEVIHGFFDKEAKEHRLVGKVFECTEKRAEELEKAELVKVLDKPKKKSK